MSKILVVANWKMNPVSKKEAENIFNGIKKGVKKLKSEIAVCPPFVYLSLLKGLKIGAQNMFYEDKGAFTGEISPLMLKNYNVDYVIIGHSERRKYFGETDEIINKKIKKALGVGLKIIFCIGETDSQRNNGEAEKIVEQQIKIGLEDISDVAGMVIAYEPVWAIGTGKACGVEDAKKMKEFIVRIITEIYGAETAGQVRILYGGSVNSQNSAGYIKEAGYNGLLVGGASLNAEEFVKIIKSAE